MASIWTQEWNNIIRYIIFQDEELKTLMEVPSNTSIIDFIDNYFISNGSNNKILSNQKVRVIYGHYFFNTENIGLVICSDSSKGILCDYSSP